MKKTILVTGASKGIGYEIATQLAKNGHKVLLTARNETNGIQAANKLVDLGLDVAFFKIDVQSLESIQSGFEAIQQIHSKLDVLINNAGVFLDRNVGIANIEKETFEATMQINFFGALWMIQKFLPLLRNSEDSRIINITSGLGAINEMCAGYPAYRISKAALNALTVNLASELGSKIKVNAVCPGWVATDMGGKGAPRTLEKGAETPVWLATSSENQTGKFWRDKKVIDW